MLTKTFEILQTLCAVYGWEVVNNHVHSSESVDNPVTQASLPAERFDQRHPCHDQEFLLTEAASLLLLWKNWWGTAPHKVRGVGESMKQ